VSADGVRVTTTARLHLGFLDLAGDLGRRFGSIGLAIDVFPTEVRMRRAAQFEARGIETNRAARYIRRLADALKHPPDVEVEIAAAIPAHAGLGSGTQLALGLAAAFRRLNGLAPDTAADAATLDRGARSGVGVALFESGGFVLDGGRGPATIVPPILARLPFPSDWRVVLAFDSHLSGVHGEVERAAFGALPPLAPSVAAELCRRALMQVAAGVAEADFRAFGEGVSAIQRILGDHFAPAQGGGRFTSPRVGRVLSRLEAAGAIGVGQSSWGPTGFAFAADPDQAEHLAALARIESGGEIDVQIHSARARGADVVSL
jgi:beta-ribofuranosylaminobenzene 5'-phosphate synthase